MMLNLDNPTRKHAMNYLHQKCAKCNEEMALVEGSVLYDGKWYHDFCWQPIKVIHNLGQ